MQEIRIKKNNGASIIAGALLALFLILIGIYLLTSESGVADAQSAAPAKPTGLTYTSVSHNSVTLR